MKQILPIIFCLFLQYTIAQEEMDSKFIEYMESMMEEENSKLDYEELTDHYTWLRNNPVDLNHATQEDLRNIPLLEDEDVYQLMRHRETYGKFQTLYELKNIPNFDQHKIEGILPFIAISEEKERFSWKKEWQHTKHAIHLQYQQGLQQKAGYRPDSLGNTRYLGPNNRYYIKYMLQTKGHISIGFLGEKDAGEAIWSKQSRLFDFNSFHIQLTNIGKISKICIGDYKASFGQGLVIGNSSFLGKSANSTQCLHPQEGIKRYTSSNESNYLRGIGCTITHKHFSATSFFSSAKKDATIKNGSITSFKTDGLHRTENELSKKHNCRETLFGANLHLQGKHFSIGGTFIRYSFKDTLLPADKSYNHFRIKGTDHHWNASLNYSVTGWKMNMWGEWAIDANGGLATINALSIQPASRVSILGIQRHYQSKYQAMHSQSFGENSSTENEHGWYIGCKILPAKKIVLNLYADVFQFPWVKYSANYPSSGHDYLTQIQHNTCRWMNMQLRYKYKEYIEQGYTRQNIRYVNHFEKKSFKGQVLLEANQVNETGKKNYGWVISEDIGQHCKKIHLEWNLHHCYFNATNYNNRFYIYEKDILNSFSMPMLYGKGHRIGANIKAELGTHIQIYLNYGMYIYTDDRTCISSGNEQIEGKISSTIKGLVRCIF